MSPLNIAPPHRNERLHKIRRLARGKTILLAHEIRSNSRGNQKIDCRWVNIARYYLQVDGFQTFGSEGSPQILPLPRPEFDAYTGNRAPVCTLLLLRLAIFAVSSRF